MPEYRYHRALHLRVTQSIYAALIDPNAKSRDGLKALHMHLTHPQIIQVAQEAADALLGDPSIGLTMRRTHEQ